MEKSFKYDPEIDVIEYVVSSINDDIFTIVEEQKHDWWLNCSYEGTSNYMCIKFLGIIIWSTEDDDREFDDELDQYKEDLETYLKKKIMELLGVLSTISFK